LLCATVPANRGPEPPRPSVPDGPVLQENIGKTAPARTYQDLLKNAHDEALFEHYLQAQLVRIGLDGKNTKIGTAGTLWGYEASPDGQYIMVQTLHRPFSYLVRASRFPRLVEVWDQSGKPVHRVADLPLQEEVPMAFGSVTTGPRSIGWRDDAPATISWVEAQDGGDAGAEADVRDKLFTLAAPFDADPTEIVRTSLRFGGVDWGNDDLALVYEWWWKTRMQRTWIIQPGSPDTEPELLFEGSWEDRYNDPGSPVMERNKFGRYVIQTVDLTA
jgi:hypothetical protein